MAALSRCGFCGWWEQENKPDGISLSFCMRCPLKLTYVKEADKHWRPDDTQRTD